MSIIAHRSPKLESLHITFCTVSGISPQLEQPSTQPSPSTRKVDPLDPPNSISNSTLKCLTSLSLHRSYTDVNGVPMLVGTAQPYEPIFGIIAKSCPLLTNLSVIGLRFCIKRDLLELLLGDIIAHQFSPFDNSLWSNDVVLNSLRISKEYLAPLCSTLQKILNSSVFVQHLIASATVRFINLFFSLHRLIYWS